MTRTPQLSTAPSARVTCVNCSDSYTCTWHPAMELFCPYCGHPAPTEPTNVFEWAWEHSQASTLAREVLTVLSWDDHHDSPIPPSWPGYRYLARDIPGHAPDIDLRVIEEAVLELVALGELALHNITPEWDLAWSCPPVTYTFPTYEASGAVTQ